MDARLPLNPHLGFYRKHAKELKRAIAQGDESAAARFVKSHPKFVGRRAAEVLGAAPSLGDAQLVIAREHGHATWGDFKHAVANADATGTAPPTDRMLAAISAADIEAVKELCSLEPTLAKKPDSKGRLPLIAACDRGLLEIARVLLDAGADPREGDPLLAAAHSGPHKRHAALDIVELLIERGAPNDVFTHATLGRVPELLASLSKIDIDARGPQHSTPLFLAAWNGQVAAVRALLEAGADPNPICRQGQSAWETVFKHSWSQPHREIAALLLEHGVECSFHEACLLSHLPTVSRLLAADPDSKDRPNAYGVTPLTLAVLNADVELAKLLLAKGATDEKGQGQALVSAKPQENQGFGGAVYRNCSFKTANFHDCTLEDVVLSNVNLSGLRIDNANLAGARIDNANVDGMTIYGIEVAPLLTKELERRAARKNAP